MRILYLLPHPNMTLQDPAGHAVRIRELIRGFEQLGGTVFVACAGEGRMEQVAKNIFRSGIRQRVPAWLCGPLRDLSYIAHDHLFRRKANEVSLGAASLDFIVEHYTFFHQTGVHLARKLDIPLILDDIPPVWEDELYYRRDLVKVARRIQSRVFGQATALIAVSGVIREYLLSCGVPEEKVHFVPNGADCNRFRAGAGGAGIRERYGLRDRIVVGFVGSFTPWHGLDLLVGCAADMVRSRNDLRFLIVGDGPVRAQLEKEARSMGLADSILFPGAFPYDQIPPFIDAMDIAVMPDSNSYGNPIKIFEYMAMEKAVVAPRIRPIEEIVTDGRDGVLFPPRDREGLRDAISHLCRDASRRAEMGWKARRKVLDHFTWVRHAETICNIAGVPLPVRGRHPV